MALHVTVILDTEANILALGAAFAAIPYQYYFATDNSYYLYGNVDGSVSPLSPNSYPINTVDNFDAVTPRNFLYTDSSGILKSSPLLKLSMTSMTAAGSPTAQQTVVFCTRSGSDYHITLGITSAYKNKVFIFKRKDSTGGSISLVPSGGVLIDGAASLPLGNKDAAWVYFDGTDYWRINR